MNNRCPHDSPKYPCTSLRPRNASDLVSAFAGARLPRFVVGPDKPITGLAGARRWLVGQQGLRRTWSRSNPWSRYKAKAEPIKPDAKRTLLFRRLAAPTVHASIDLPIDRLGVLGPTVLPLAWLSAISVRSRELTFVDMQAEHISLRFR